MQLFSYICIHINHLLFNLKIMKKLLIAVFTLLACNAFAQGPQKNGTIFKDHPYIAIVNNSNDLF
jgi:hypothetical protein